MKVLIYYDKNYLSPSGGPAGYLYNLNEELKKRKIYNIDFLSDQRIYYRKKIKSIMLKLPILKGIACNISQKNNKNLCLEIANKIYNADSYKTTNVFDEYDIIHFHSTGDMYCEKNNLKNYKGIVILTSHSPEPFFQELIKTCPSEDFYKSHKEKFDNVENADIYAFQRADFILFPCEYAEEPYYNTWDKYIKIREKNKMKYIPTGILPVQAKLTREEVRTKYGIPMNAFLISFVGRHNEIKGYDVLKKLAKYLNSDKTIYFICCGNESPLSRPDLENWIEVGWTNDPYSLVQASDLYLLPNKETYFDIAILQTLSLGKISLISDTGGNKFFRNHEDEGIFIYTDFKSLVEKVYFIKGMDKSDIIKRQLMQKKYFNENFTIANFCDQYISLLEELYNCN